MILYQLIPYKIIVSPPLLGSRIYLDIYCSLFWQLLDPHAAEGWVAAIAGLSLELPRTLCLTLNPLLRIECQQYSLGLLVCGVIKLQSGLISERCERSLFHTESEYPFLNSHSNRQLYSFDYPTHSLSFTCFNLVFAHGLVKILIDMSFPYGYKMAAPIAVVVGYPIQTLFWTLE